MTAHQDDHARYQLAELLGRGGMGEVWRAYDTRLDRAVAIKFLTSGVVEEGDRDRFAREAKVAAQLTHPNIVAIYDAGEWGDRPYIVLELVPGTTLAQELASHGPLPVEQVVRAGAQVADGLGAAHAIGVIHRDVKPGNLIRAADDRIKILDFGIARLLDERATRLTRPGLLVGTAGYSAPEQITTGVADERSDLYALGCVLYELLTGRPPFEGDLAAVAYGHVHRAPVPPSDLRPDLPAELASLVSVLMAKDPDARPASAAEVAEVLRRPGTLLAASEAPPPLPMGPPPLPMAHPSSPATPADGSGPPPSRSATTPMHTSVLDPRAAGSGDRHDAARMYGPGGPDVPPSQDDARRGRRGRRWWFGLVAASAVLALLVGAVGLLTRDRTSGEGPGEEPAIAESPRPTPTPEESGPGSGDHGPDEDPPWARQMEREMDRLRDAGRIGSDTAEDIRDSVNDAIEQNRPDKAREKLEKLQEKWNKNAERWDRSAEEWSSELLDDLPAPP